MGLAKQWDRDQTAPETDPDQTEGAVWSGTTLFAIPSESFDHINEW